MPRLPFLAAGVLLLVVGLGGGLARLGWPLAATTGALVLHGPLIVGAFFGTVISLERAAAMGRRWVFVAALLAALSGIAGLANSFAATFILMMGASAILFAACLVALWERRESYLGVMALGPLAWFTAAAMTFSGQASEDTAPLWMSFLIFTIVGEHIAAKRFAYPPEWSSRVFLFPVGFLAAGASYAAVGQGGLVFGLGEVFCGLWLLGFDSARYARKETGLQGFIGRSLSMAYVWMLAAGLLTIYGAMTGDMRLYDAQLHAVFFGFVISTVFGHVPMVVPKLLKKTLTFVPALYLPFVLLHLSLIFRVLGAWLEFAAMLRWAALGNGLALLLFLILVIVSVRRQGVPRIALNTSESH